VFNVSYNRITLLLGGKHSRRYPLYRSFCLKWLLLAVLRAEIVRKLGWWEPFLTSGLLYKPSWLDRIILLRQMETYIPFFSLTMLLQVLMTLTACSKTINSFFFLLVQELCCYRRHQASLFA
jgi:hypothetical protein